MILRMLFMLIVVGLAFAGIYTFQNFKSDMVKQYMSQMASSPQTVAIITATYEVWDNKLDSVGTLKAVSGVDISSEVAGIIENIYFESGDHVAAQTLLVKLRAEEDLAYLASLKADSHLAYLTYERDVQQLKQKAVAQSVADLSSANYEKSLALVQQQEAIIDKKFIRAPFSGRLGIRQIDLGEFISPGTMIVTLQELDPIFFDFFLPQQELPNIKIDQVVNVQTNLYVDKTFTGKIWAVNSKVDPASRNIQIRAMIDNHQKVLLPGMYGVVDIDIGKPQKYVTLPQTAVTYNPYGNTVYIATSKRRDKAGNQLYLVDQRFVTVGPTRGDQVAISSGVDAGELVVVAGQLKIHKGSLVTINNDVLPTNDINPRPSEQ